MTRKKSGRLPVNRITLSIYKGESSCELSESVHERRAKPQGGPEGHCEAAGKIDPLFNKAEGAAAGLVCCHRLGPTAVDFRGSRPNRKPRYVGCCRKY